MIELEKMSASELKLLANRALEIAREKEKEEKTEYFRENCLRISNRVRLDAGSVFDYTLRAQVDVMHGVDGDWYRGHLLRQHVETLKNVQHVDDLLPLIEVKLHGVVIGTMEMFDTSELNERETSLIVNGFPRLERWLERQLQRVKEYAETLEQKESR